MKKAKALSYGMALALGVTALAPVALADTAIPAPTALSTMSAASTRTIKGQFTDFFPDAIFAQIVAEKLGKNASDQVTLFELQKITNINISYYPHNPQPLLNSLEGIGYLMGLKEVHLYETKSVKIPDDIENCYQLERFTMAGCGILELPESLGRIKSLKQVFINTGQFPIVPDSILQKAKTGEIHFDSECLAIGTPSTAELGQDINLKQLVPEVAFYLNPLDQEHSKNMISVLDESGNVVYLLEQGGYNIEEFIAVASKKLKENLKTAGKYTIEIESATWCWGGYSFELNLTRGPLTKDINAQTKTHDQQYDINIVGQIKGDFTGSSNKLDRAAIDAQDLTITANGNPLGKESILSITVAVANEQIIAVTIVGMINGSVFIVNA